MSKFLKKGYFILALILLVSIAVTFGCEQAAPPTTAKPTTPAVTAKTGGILVMNIPEPYSLGFPSTMTGQTDGQNAGVCLETLFRLDEKGNPVPLLATDWKADPTAKTITISLRKGVKFHDGSDFNAEVVKWNMDTYRTGARTELAGVTSVDMVDDYTVRLNLKEFDNSLITQLTNASEAGRMISMVAAKANGGKAWCEKNPVGTGPFQFVSWTPDVAIKWKRFDGYWGGKPYLDGINMVRIADSLASIMEFKAGNIDILNPGQITARDAKSLEAEGKYILAIAPEGQVPAIAGNTKDPKSIFANLKVRQAVTYALDVKQLTETFGLGYWKQQNQWAIPGTWGYNTNVKGYPYDPNKAKQLLAEAGYPNGFDTKLSFFNLAQRYIDEAVAISGMLKAVGINAQVNGLLRPAFAEAASLGKGWDGLIRQQGYSSPDPVVKYALMVGGQEFLGALMPEEFVTAFNNARTAPDQATKTKYVMDMESLAVDKYCVASYLWMESSTIFKQKWLMDDLHGVVPYRYINPKAWLNK
jgi:peptide/nickel transport system substrate-binding protein